MKISIKPEAVSFFKNEMGLEKGRQVRFTSKVYGKTKVHNGFSVAVRLEEAKDPLVQVEEEGILFYIEKSDEWFFNPYDFVVDYNEEKDALDFDFLTEEEEEFE